MNGLLGQGSSADVGIEGGLELVLGEVLRAAVDQNLETEVKMGGTGVADGLGREGIGVGNEGNEYEDGGQDYDQNYAEDFGGAVGGRMVGIGGGGVDGRLLCRPLYAIDAVSSGPASWH